MTVEELISFRNLIHIYLKMIGYHESFVDSQNLSRSREAAKVLDFMLPKLRSITQFYIKKFCNESTIAANNAFLATIRVDILLKVREHVDVPLPRTYAKLLHTSKK